MQVSSLFNGHHGDEGRKKHRSARVKWRDGRLYTRSASFIGHVIDLKDHVSLSLLLITKLTPQFTNRLACE